MTAEESMIEGPPTDDERQTLRRILAYQFGPEAPEAVLTGDLGVTRTSSGRIEQLFADGQRLCTLGMDGRVTISVLAGRRLAAGSEPPCYRVMVGEESVEFILDGKNAFTKFVHDVDPDVRPGDEVVVVHDGTALGVGRAEQPATAMADLGRGVAVSVRHGAGD